MICDVVLAQRLTEQDTPHTTTHDAPAARPGGAWTAPAGLEGLV